MEHILKSSFTIVLPDNAGYISVHPEMSPEAQGISPTGRYFVYYLHPTNGSCHFIMDQDETCRWYSDMVPPFVKADVFKWISAKIEECM